MAVLLKELLDYSANTIEAELTIGKKTVILRKQKELSLAGYRTVIDSYLENNVFKLILEPVSKEEIRKKVEGLSINFNISKREARHRLEKVFFNTTYVATLHSNNNPRGCY